MGEFSFLVGREALREDVISEAVNDAILAAVLVSIFIAPLLFAVHERAIAVARAAPIIGPMIAPRTDTHLPDADGPGLFNHAIIVGYTQAGRALASALTTRGFRYVVIDEEPMVFQRLKERGVNVILGDASLPTILTQAAVQSAWVLAITVPNPGMIETVAATGRGLNRRIDVVTRADSPEGRERLRRLGVGRTVDSEFEAATQFVSHTLQRFGISRQEVQMAMWRLRQDRVRDIDSQQ
jgi:CPA2 family monovalent cation:H+ antiporter-2